MVCAIEGVLSVALVPHVFRQELNTGQMKGSIYEDREPWNNKKLTPINLFMSPSPADKEEMRKYPHWKPEYLTIKHLGAGDCMFVPAYYFHQVSGFRQMSANRSDNGATSPLFQMPSFFYTDDAKSIEETGGNFYDSDKATAVQLWF